MEYFLLIGTVIIIHFLGAASPGPDFILTIRNSLTYSRRTGFFSSLGIALGNLVHIAYCILGLAVIISQSIFIFNIIKYIGAMYLIYIGIMSIRAKPTSIKINTKHHKKDLTPFQALGMGFLCNVLNPKCSLFYLGLFSMVIAPETPNWILLILTTVMFVDTFLWFSMVTLFFTQKRVRDAFLRFEGFFNKTFGGLLILLGFKVALSKK